MAESPLSNITRSPAADRLKDEAQAYLMAQVERVLVGVGHRLGDATVKLNDIADGKSPGFGKLAAQAGKKLAEGKGPVRGALELGGSHLKDKVTDTLKGLGGKRKKGGGGQKPTVILEFVDVGVPVREAYDQWTQYQEFSTFTKGVKSATAANDTETDWKLKVFWSSRSWKAHTTEQVPDQRITWTSEGAKGSTKGVVTFHALAENLTRVLLVIEYYPKGLFEKTGNIWRAQGRRARLDLKNFARHISMRGEASDGWRGEIRDGEVVRTHEDAVAEEEADTDEVEGSEDQGPEDEYEPRSEAEYDEYDEDEDDREDEPGAEYEDEPEGEADYEDDEDGEPRDDEPEDEHHDPDEEDEEFDEEHDGEPEAEYDDELDDDAESDADAESDPDASDEDEVEDAEIVDEDEDDDLEDDGDDEDVDDERRESADAGRSRR
ncbi:SRPBCC family protein [Streptomyces sp. NPDC005898]|uniref:SRPBCC family protein n=1 Tax=Streptomyces sp. NPDC005898 TaxID=3157082 RepID=UPI00340933AD